MSVTRQHKNRNGTGRTTNSNLKGLYAVRRDELSRLGRLSAFLFYLLMPHDLAWEFEIEMPLPCVLDPTNGDPLLEKLPGHKEKNHVAQICDLLLGRNCLRRHNRIDAYGRVRCCSWRRGQRAATGDLELAALC
jgi:hypothetical protein